MHSPSSCFKPVWISFSYWTQRKIFWGILVSKQLMVAIDFHCMEKHYESQWLPSTLRLPTFCKIPSVVSKIKKLILGTSGRWVNGDNLNFWITIYFSGVFLPRDALQVKCLNFFFFFLDFWKKCLILIQLHILIYKYSKKTVILWKRITMWREVQVMVTHTHNLSSVFNPSKFVQWIGAVNSEHTHIHTHP